MQNPSPEPLSPSEPSPSPLPTPPTNKQTSQDIFADFDIFSFFNLGHQDPDIMISSTATPLNPPRVLSFSELEDLLADL